MADKLIYGVEQLKAKATDIGNISTGVHQTNTQIMAIISDLNSVFLGEAASRFIERSDEVVDSLNNSLKELQEALVGIITNMSDTMGANDSALATSVNTDIVTPITK